MKMRMSAMILVFALISCVCAQKTDDPVAPGLPKDIEIIRARTWPQYHLPLIARYPQRLVEKFKLHPDSTDLPYMVRGDFNGDGLEDIAFMLSGEFGKSPRKICRTRLIVMYGRPNGWETALDMIYTSAPPWGSEYFYLGRVSKGEYKGCLNGEIREPQGVILQYDGFTVTMCESGSSTVFFSQGERMQEHCWGE
jgi:hypothetical protein